MSICLAVESSCDETSVAIVKDGREVLSNIIYSQIDIHKKYGGVVPEIASRNHVEKITYVVEQALKEANVGFDDIDFIGATYGPGLVGAVLVGLSYAKALAFAKGIPLVGVNHIEGHISANYIQNKELKPPFVCLVVSGGHTHLVNVKGYNEFEIIGRTRDDAAGEAYDKVARAIGFGYPGGPLIDKAAKNGNANSIQFPKAYIDNDSYDFSFSGVKSAVLNYLNSQKQKKIEINYNDVAASFQESVVEVLVNKAIRAAIEYKSEYLAIAGGVAANSHLRERISQEAAKHNIKVTYPAIVLCTDNAAMIGCAAYYRYKDGIISGLDLNAVPNLKIGER